jgi:hypothetical protein
MIPCKVVKVTEEQGSAADRWQQTLNACRMFSSDEVKAELKHKKRQDLSKEIQFSSQYCLS